MTPRSWLPHPLLSLVLLLIWLLLVNTLSPGHVVLGTVLSVVVPLFTRGFWPEHPPCVRVTPAVRYILVLFGDIIVANIQVAKLILGPASRLQPAFVHYPLELEGEFPITVLASTISLTPGTVSADVSADRKTLLIHVLDMDDEQKLIETIRHRYENKLKEIFQC